MSASTSADPLRTPGAASKSKKKKNKKKNGSGTKVDETATVNRDHEREDDKDGFAEDGEKHTPAAHLTDPDAVDDEQPLSYTAVRANGTTSHPVSPTLVLQPSRSPSQQELASSPLPADTNARLDAIAKERDALRQEVTELRKRLESIQEKHDEERNSLQAELEELNEGKEHFETQYNNLLGRVNTIKTSLGDRLKADAAKIEEYQTQISELEARSHDIEETNTSLATELDKLRRENEAQAAEAAAFRSRTNLMQQSWIEERDELISREAYAREELENAKQAMGDWEVLAMNERSIRQGLSEKESELIEQLELLRERYEQAVRDRDTNSQTVDGLQNALQEVQSIRKSELKRAVQQYESQINELRKQVQVAEESAKSSKASLDTTLKELDRALPFEKEAKEKNLLIGKLRHEAVTLNEHLTKALRILKKGRPEDNVDRQIMTNYFLHFLALDRSDPKKFEALQLIAALLGWTQEQREQAGLSRPGATNASLRVPTSPFRRTPSTPSLNSGMSDPMLMASSSSNKESLAALWSDFLEREAGDGSRRNSEAMSSLPRSEAGSGLGITE